MSLLLRMALEKRLAEKQANEKVCPFCGEGDFDLIGLKGHLEHGDCGPYNEIEVRRRVFR